MKKLLSSLGLSIILFFTLGSSSAIAEEVPTPSSSPSSIVSCEKVENPYSSKDDWKMWNKYNKLIAEYKKSCFLMGTKTTEYPGKWGYENGVIPPSELEFIVDNEFMLKPEAAAAFNEMNDAYKAETGNDLQVNSGYRSYAAQWNTWLTNTKNAAYPGTSGHGGAISLDLATAGGYEEQGEWLKENSEDYGWINPAWAYDGLPPEEPWHFDFLVESDPTLCKDIFSVEHCS